MTGTVLSYGVQVAATRSVPTAPGKIRSPSPGRRAGPHTKQPGKGCVRWPGYDASASAASRAGAGATAVGACSAYDASATSPPSWLIVAPLAVAVSGIGVSSGGGWRRVTVTARPIDCPGSRAARAPATQPPLPERGGPLNRWGTSSVVTIPSLPAT